MRPTKYAQRTAWATENGYVVRPDGVVVGRRGRPLKLQPTKRGYLTFTVAAPIGNGGHGPVFVHVLVALQKFGARALASGVQARHLNGVKGDNRSGNIAIGSQSVNMMDRPRADRLTHGKIAARVLRALDDREAQELLRDRARGATYRVLCKKYGIAKSTVSGIVRRKVYREL